MGLNTAVLILNDHLNVIEKDYQFGKKVSDGICLTTGRPNVRHYHSGFDCLPSVHADYNQFVIIGQNSIRRFCDLDKEEAKSMLKEAAREAGLSISIKG